MQLFTAQDFFAYVVAIPGLMEPRFFLPAFVLLYAIVAFAVVDNPKVYLRAFKNPRMWLAYFSYMWLAITLSGATMGNLYPYTPLFGGVPAPQSTAP